MPSSYTANIYDGKPETLESFLLKCARQFYANVRMREDSLDSEIVEYTPNTKYYEENLERAKARLAELQAMSREEIEAIIEETHKNSLESYQIRVQEKLDMRARYEHMIHQVENWTPPTDEHVNLKEFALNQLKDSLDFDCGHMPTEPTKLTVDEYIDVFTERYNSDISYYTKSIEKEIENVTKANEWNNALKRSLQSSGK